MRRRLVLAGAVLVLAVVAMAAVARLTAPAERWGRVERRDLVLGIEVEGELEAVESDALGPPQLNEVWSFKIARMAPEGQEVAAGFPVLTFDTTQLQQELQQKSTERDQAEKELEKKERDIEIERRDLQLQRADAEARLRRAKLKTDVPAEVEKRHELEKARIDRRLAELEIRSLDSTLEHLAIQSKAELDALRGTRDRAAARVQEIEEAIGRMTVTAPRAGTVIYKTNWQGEKKKVGDTAWRAETVVEIPDLGRMQASGQVDEALAGRLAVGQPVDLRLDAHPDRTYRGRVESIQRTVQRKSVRSPLKVVALTIVLDETDPQRMRPGMRFRGTIEAERVADTLVVPEEAIIPTPEGGVVIVGTPFGRRQVEPTFGRRNAELFEVLDGLDEGDRLLLGGSSVEPSS